MNKKLVVPAMIILVLFLMTSLAAPVPVKAGGVVGTGTPESCTEVMVDAALVGGGLVTFDCGPDPWTITLSAQKAISFDTTIDGGNLINLEGAALNRLFTVNLGSALTLRHISLAGGNALTGGAIYNDGTLNLIDVSLAGNNAPAGAGGAIINQGLLTVIDSLFSYNSAGGSAGAILNNGTAEISGSSLIYNWAGDGGAIANSGILNLHDTEFIGNIAEEGGGAAIKNTGNLFQDGCTFSSNLSSDPQSGIGGGIYNTESGAAIILTSTFMGNSALVGGGVYNAGQMTVEKCTFEANYATGSGGGMVIVSTTPTMVNNSTFSGNTAGTVGGGVDIDGFANFSSTTFYNNTPDGVMNAVSAWVTVINTILAYNSTSNCHGAAMTSQGNNLDSGITCALDEAGDLANTNPLLGPLADNGGSTLTHALQLGSPAINAGTNFGCPVVDQRGMTRPLFGICDIGSFEFGWRANLPLVVK